MASTAKDQDSIKYLDSILAMIPGHLYWKDKDGKYLGCNNLQAIDAGLTSKEDIIGLTDYDMPWKDDAEFLRKVDAQVISTGEGVVVEEKLRSVDGKDEIWLSHKEPLRDASGEIIGIIGNSVDVTDKKASERLESEIKAYHARERAQEKFTKFIEEIQSVIESYRTEILNEKLGTHLRYDGHEAEIKLTKRESEILYFLSLNKSPKEISLILSKIQNKEVSSATVASTINKQLYHKFGVFNISDLIDKANALKLIPFIHESLEIFSDTVHHKSNN